MVEKITRTEVFEETGAIYERLAFIDMNTLLNCSMCLKRNFLANIFNMKLNIDYCIYLEKKWFVIFTALSAK